MAVVASSDMKAKIHEIRGDVQKYKPGSVSRPPDRITFPDTLVIGLLGLAGSGKTSLINSLRFAVSGQLKRARWLQVAAQEKAGGQTMYRKHVNLTESISVVDNRGLDDSNIEDTVEELRAQLNGERGYTEKVEWQKMVTREDEEYEDIELDESKGHKIGCAVFVFSATHDINTNTDDLAEVIDLLHTNQGRYPLAVITHVDVSDKKAVGNLKTVLRVCGVSDIFEVANLTHEKETLEEAYQLNLLNLLDRCMTDGDDTLIFHHFQKKDQERKRKLEQKRLRRERRENEQKQSKVEQQRSLDQEHNRQERERDRELKHQEAMKQIENNKEVELIRIMQATKKKKSCSVM